MHESQVRRDTVWGRLWCGGSQEEGQPRVKSMSAWPAAAGCVLWVLGPGHPTRSGFSPGLGNILAAADGGMICLSPPTGFSVASLPPSESAGFGLLLLALLLPYVKLPTITCKLRTLIYIAKFGK